MIDLAVIEKTVQAEEQSLRKAARRKAELQKEADNFNKSGPFSKIYAQFTSLQALINPLSSIEEFMDGTLKELKAEYRRCWGFEALNFLKCDLHYPIKAYVNGDNVEYDSSFKIKDELRGYLAISLGNYQHEWTRTETYGDTSDETAYDYLKQIHLFYDKEGRIYTAEFDDEKKVFHVESSPVPDLEQHILTEVAKVVGSKFFAQKLAPELQKRLGSSATASAATGGCHL